jgi:hypothetical protein
VPDNRYRCTEEYFVVHDTFMVDPSENICVPDVSGLMKRPSEYRGGGGRYVVV